MTIEITNNDDIIDSRDVIERIEELRSTEPSDMEKADREELAALVDLAAECKDCPDWQYGETLISDSYFEDYAREFAEDIGAIDKDANWPLGCIDWGQAAAELQMDYMEVVFDGVTYYIRA